MFRKKQWKEIEVSSQSEYLATDHETLLMNCIIVIYASNALFFILKVLYLCQLKHVKTEHFINVNILIILKY